MISRSILTFRTAGRGTTDITAEVARVVSQSNISEGLCNVFLRHTSASLLVGENADPDVRKDLETILSRLAPDGDPAYVHNTEGDDDMAAHARAMLTSTSVNIPVADGELMLGTWQGLFLWEHRTSSHSRQAVVTIVGE
ncbi:MAG TPA: secondary thiamine-phosphate synthase enzyme YjbQ [Burkholderiales bacterium]|nr:secondary thiamine-phosphate synthase enzyme YjbQ [Burkholderiales bacterium]